MASVRDIKIKIETQLIDTIHDCKILVDSKNNLLRALLKNDGVKRSISKEMYAKIVLEINKELELSEF